jgi:hypothetical protein
VAAEDSEMKSLWLIATVLAGTIVLESAPAIAEDIALSFVNPNGRIDIPAGAITRVEASATIAFRNAETKEIVDHPDPHVELCFSERFGGRSASSHSASSTSRWLS